MIAKGQSRMIGQPADTFYDDMATAYHLIFDDWDAAIERQQAVLSRLLPSPSDAGPVLDCACGIGTQALGLARAGYHVVGTDLSRAAIKRAKAEAAARRLDVSFRVDDMRELRTYISGGFGVVLAFDNALPHLASDDDVRSTLGAMHNRLRLGGRLLISLRDYGPLIEQRPGMTPPTIFSDDGRRRIVHQVWDWQDERRYTVHLYITRQMPNDAWVTSHFLGHYRAITPQEVAAQMEQVGFRQIEIRQPVETGYYQPVVTAIRQV
jgi:glycine/sarcosine N-methyltransferase